MKYLMLILASFECFSLVAAEDAKTPTSNEKAAEARQKMLALLNSTRSSSLANPSIDMEGYLRVSQEAAKHRETRRVTEDDFIKILHRYYRQ
ncbi:MAG: hypothetical protein K8T89_21695 [Planctomycetes bacterium]|nr:hypothetical protein [Planctomycetota bacterium]